MSISKRLRFEVFRRDGYTCMYCGRRAPSVILEADHRMPRCKGGADTLDNLVSACWDCNRGKGPLDFEGRQPERWEFSHGSWQEWIEATAPDTLPDGLPRCLNRRDPKAHINFHKFDLHKAASEMPRAETVLLMTVEAVMRKAELF